MNNSSNKKRLIILTVVGVLLIAAVLLTLFFSKSNAKSNSVENSSQSVAYTFVYVDGDGNEKKYELSSDKSTVGEALLDEGLIAGEESSYGLYVKEVDGIVADYDKDGTYWAFYIDDAYASTGVDSTPLESGHTYTFKVEK